MDKVRYSISFDKIAFTETYTKITKMKVPKWGKIGPLAKLNKKSFKHILSLPFNQFKVLLLKHPFILKQEGVNFDCVPFHQF